MTLDQFIEKLQELREEYGGTREVYVSVPWEDGVLTHTEEIKNIFYAEEAFWIVPTSRIA